MTARTFSILCLAVLFGLFFFSPMVQVEQSYLNNGDRVVDTHDTQHGLAYTQHAPIVITSNDDFVSQGWPGAGTNANPYVISGLNITTAGTCIRIENTTAYFIISNSLLAGGVTGFGITLKNVTNGNIFNNTIRDKSFGIYLEIASNNIIHNNTVRYSQFSGIELTESSMNDVYDNVLTNNGYDGMKIWSASFNNTIYGNYIFNNTQSGIYLTTDAVNNTMKYNNVTLNSDYGIRLQVTGNNVIQENFVKNNTNDGIHVRTSNDIDVINNTILMNGNDGIEIYNSTNTMIYLNTIIANTEQGIRTAYRSNHTIISDNTINLNNVSGIFMDQVGPADILGNNLFNNSLHGIYLSNCTDERILHNNATWNQRIGIIVLVSDNITVSFNNLTENFAYGASFDSTNNTILSNNTIVSNTDMGIWMTNAGHNIIANNTIIDNGLDGFYVSSDHNLTIVQNVFESNGRDGILYGYSHDVVIYNNTFSSNLKHGFENNYEPENTTLYFNIFMNNNISNAYDSTGLVYWNTTMYGNYWDDYDGSGTYAVDGSPNAIDYHPFPWPNTDRFPPIIDHPADVSYAEGSTGHTITWNPYDDNPDHYEILRNGTSIVNTSWDGSAISLNVDGLSRGIYNYTIVVYDRTGHTNNDSVYVIVNDATAPSIDHPDDIHYDEGSIGNSITWSPSDLHPNLYEVYRDGLKIESGQWTGGSIVVNVDGHTAGIYNYTLRVLDQDNNEAQDTVFVYVEDHNAPTVDHPADISYVVGETGHSIQWSATDNHPDHYSLYRNGTHLETHAWNGSPVTIDVDGLLAGTYNYTIVFYDESGNSVSDTVIVTVTPSSTTTTTTTTTSTTQTTTSPEPSVQPSLNEFLIIAAIGGVGLLIVVYCLYMRRH